MMRKTGSKRLFAKSLPCVVMARFKRAIHVFTFGFYRKDVDGRVKPGHDEVGLLMIQAALANFSDTLEAASRDPHTAFIRAIAERAIGCIDKRLPPIIEQYACAHAVHIVTKA